MTNDQFVRKRIRELRKIKKVTEQQMSLDLGRNKGYIQNIMTGRTFPTMEGFFKICDYLGVSLQDFFNEDSENSVLASHVAGRTRKLDESGLNAVLSVINAIDKDNSEEETNEDQEKEPSLV
jgi:transcriptional regulator with XRE-family HTH domain